MWKWARAPPRRRAQRKFYDFVRLLFASTLFGPRDYLLNTNAGRGGGVEAADVNDSQLRAV